MTGQLEQVVIERRQHLCTADKLRLMAQTLRSCRETQCIGQFHDPRNNSFCAYGALGYLSGIPKNELGKSDFNKVLRNYGMDLDEAGLGIILPDNFEQDRNYPQRQSSVFQAIYQLNDHGYDFKEIATYLDIWADNLQS